MWDKTDHLTISFDFITRAVWKYVRITQKLLDILSNCNFTAGNLNRELWVVKASSN